MIINNSVNPVEALYANRNNTDKYTDKIDLSAIEPPFKFKSLCTPCPKCFYCANCINGPNFIGGKPKCSKYNKIPDKIYINGHKCKFFEEEKGEDVVDFIYSVSDAVVQDFALPFNEVSDFSFEFMGKKYTCRKGIDVSINNQGGYLRQDNFFGTNQEYTLLDECGKTYPIVYHLYQNSKGHYRIFLFTRGTKMLTSVNLSTGLEKNNSGRIILEIQIKITSPQNVSKIERQSMRDECIKKLKEHGMRFDKNNRVYLGEYDIPSRTLIHTTPQKLLQDMLIIGICRNVNLFDL